jgi:hypothetical protein
LGSSRKKQSQEKSRTNEDPKKDKNQVFPFFSSFLFNPFFPCATSERKPRTVHGKVISLLNRCFHGGGDHKQRQANKQTNKQKPRGDAFQKKKTKGKDAQIERRGDEPGVEGDRESRPKEEERREKTRRIERRIKAITKASLERKFQEKK